MTQPAMYTNPILPMDYSDPDAIRVGDDYYMISSSFTYVPGVPVLHSRDLVHWRRVGYCVQSLPFERYRLPAHGCGTWAPALRYHDGLFWAFIPLPDEGIFVTSAKDPAGTWSPLRCIKSVSGWIDPCPLWDEDGSVYMAHAFANSRCGIKHKLQMSRLDPVTLMVIDDGPIVFDGVQTQPTAEGPKLYRRDGWYYIFIPAGGVETGWQTVLRSRNIYGPYEEKIVLHQGNTPVNGPHQGAWVSAADESDWFLHFQDRDACGRVVHLQPMCWRNGWPFLGQEQNGDGIGEPVPQWFAPHGENIVQNGEPQSLLSDGTGLAKSWQWQANPQQHWCDAFQHDALRLHCVAQLQTTLWQMPNVLSQMLPDETFTFSVHMLVQDMQPGGAAGVGVLGLSYSALQILVTEQGLCAQLLQGQTQSIAPTADAVETALASVILSKHETREPICIKIQVQNAKKVEYFVNNRVVGTPQPVVKCVWTGARIALFCKGDTGACLFENAQLAVQRD